MMAPDAYWSAVSRAEGERESEGGHDVRGLMESASCASGAYSSGCSSSDPRGCPCESLSDDERRQILDLHNERREQSASGNELCANSDFSDTTPCPAASKMNALIWDSSLEAIATYWAHQCIWSHHVDVMGYSEQMDRYQTLCDEDGCMATGYSNDTWIGENLACTATDGTPSWSITNALEALIDGTMSLNSIIGTIRALAVRQVITRWAFTMSLGTLDVDMQTAMLTVHLVPRIQIGSILRVNTIPEGDGVERIPMSLELNAVNVNRIGVHVLELIMHSVMAGCASIAQSTISGTMTVDMMIVPVHPICIMAMASGIKPHRHRPPLTLTLIHRLRNRHRHRLKPQPPRRLMHRLRIQLIHRLIYRRRP